MLFWFVVVCSLFVTLSLFPKSLEFCLWHLTKEPRRTLYSDIGNNFMFSCRERVFDQRLRKKCMKNTEKPRKPFSYVFVLDFSKNFLYRHFQFLTSLVLHLPLEVYHYVQTVDTFFSPFLLPTHLSRSPTSWRGFFRVGSTTLRDLVSNV